MAQGVRSALVPRLTLRAVAHAQELQREYLERDRQVSSKSSGVLDRQHQITGESPASARFRLRQTNASQMNGTCRWITTGEGKGRRSCYTSENTAQCS
eukprot:IDg15904t1